MSKIQGAYEEHLLTIVCTRGNRSDAIAKQLDRAYESGFFAGYRAACKHEMVCVNDGKHGREKVWRCRVCGETEYR